MWTVKVRRFGTIHIIRYYEVLRDGEHVDYYPTRDLAEAYAQFMNTRDPSTTFTLSDPVDDSQ